MKFRFGLQARYLIASAITLAVVLALVTVLLLRQSAMQQEVDRLGRDAMHAMAVDAMGRRGNAMVNQLADTMANPLYYSDLDAMGTLVRATIKQPDVSYVVVYDNAGNIIHDGSFDIAGYGQPMTDALASRVIASNDLLTLWSAEVLDVSEPIFIGEHKLGGVRVGYSLAELYAEESRAANNLKQRLQDLGKRHMGWFVALLAALAITTLLVALYVQRTLVKPIQQLADFAHNIGQGNYETAQIVSRRKDELGELVRAFGSMSESVARHNRDVRRMAYTDALTGLTNRLAFRESVEQRLITLQAAGRQLALLFADIDDFKRVNDGLGHEAGDEVLIQFANRMSELVHREGGEGALLARLGGDEFVILVESGDVRATATRLADAMVHELSMPLRVQERQVFLGVSIGITMFPEDATSVTKLMKNGDIAMYQAKFAGKNCHRFYSRAMNQAAEQRIYLEQELRGAWERDELTLLYQPVFRLSDHCIVGAEALLRWQHPEMGAVEPSVFIDVAEQSGLIETIGPRVLKEACMAAAQWKPIEDSQEKPFVAVNVSPRQLRSGDLPEIIAECIASSKLSTSQLHVELTETAIISNEAQAALLLGRLRRTGVKVWLDDFGTGFSGLNHLRSVPVDGVKIDRSFITDMLRDPDDLALTTAIIAMAHSLGITVVAEGVEAEGQYDLLRARGCDLAQGFWLGYPVSAADLNQLLS